MYKTIQDAAKDALAVQNACNLSGVAHSFLDAIAVIRESGLSTNEINRHPVISLFLSKMVSLNSTDCFCSLCLNSYRETSDRARLVS